MNSHTNKACVGRPGKESIPSYLASNRGCMVH